ncbi:cellulase [Streptomyces viridodiastaticus]|uniref:cellulase n=1 Tax=Streptomyces albogriseolus TaxID=1887 RepID=UPI00224D410F|nr:cellulase [Streptomyces viridodiastaticus]MCX4565324.1 cellulase [Streptomyces viridodiastaticus]
MDDFERELTRMMREGRAHTPFDPGRRARLYEGIRARRRTRVLVRAGGSALAVAGLSVGLAFLPHLGSGPAPADLPLPATGSTAPPRSGGPTGTASGTAEPSTSAPPTRGTGAGTPGDTPPGDDRTGHDGPRLDALGTRVPAGDGVGNLRAQPRQHPDLPAAERVTPHGRP